MPETEFWTDERILWWCCLAQVWVFVICVLLWRIAYLLEKLVKK
jgi:hypothetical protein